MNDERPDYLPAEVWRVYGELRARGAIEAPTYRVPVLRLLGLHPEAPDGMARTWRALQRQIAAAGRPAWAASDWRLLFELLWTLPESFDRGAYSALKRARELAPRIAALARDLSRALQEYADLAERHSLAIPLEGLGGFELIESAGKHQGEPASGAFEDRCLPFFGFSVPRRVDVNYLPAPARMAEALGLAFDGFEPAASEQLTGYANAAEVSQQRAIISHFEDRWGWYQGANRPDLMPPSVIAARFDIGATDLARILTALFGFPFSRESVNYARGERAKNRKD